MEVVRDLDNQVLARAACCPQYVPMASSLVPQYCLVSLNQSSHNQNKYLRL
jgi:hypothetical protein